jgi:uncharacterized membrane protein HdeD (DUF308 family)
MALKSNSFCDPNEEPAMTLSSIALPNISRGMPIGSAAWEWTLVCGFLKVLLAMAALALPLLETKPMIAGVGWLLIAGGAGEFVLGWGSRRSHLGALTLISGAVTIIAGTIFVVSGWDGFFPLLHVMTIWLLLRAWVAIDVGLHSRNTLAANWEWLTARGLVDLGLGMTLLIGIPITSIVILLFGRTKEVVATFGVLLAVSFAVAGVGLIAIALAQRRWAPAVSTGDQ